MKLTRLKAFIQFEKNSLLSFAIILVFAISVYYYMSQNKVYEASSKALSYVEAGYSDIQRITKLELEEVREDYLLVKMDNIMTELLLPNKLSKYFPENCDLEIIILNFFEDWKLFYSSLEDYRENNARNTLFSVSENIYDNSIKNIKLINMYIETIELNISHIRVFIDCLLMSMILLFMKKLVNLNYELDMSKELSNDMHIDVATGLYDRTKCQELLRNPTTADMKSEMERGVLIISINSFKNLSNKCKKKFGKQVISAFATDFKNATKVFPFEVFVGRYGVHEFMIFFEYATQKDMNIYIEEVKFIVGNFNKNPNKAFDISCSIKYAITTENNRDITSRELFNIAQKDKNKNEIIVQ